MATTPNYGWVMPDPTDFVTSLPADFEIFGDAVDATVDGIETTANAALPETIIDAAGDLIYGSAADTAARLAIGTANQVLQVNAGATAPEWVTAAGGTKNFSLLNAGGTALSGSATVTVSSLSGYDQFLVLIDLASSVSASGTITLRLNADSAANYDFNGSRSIAEATYGAGNIVAAEFGHGSTAFTVGNFSSNAASFYSGAVLLGGCNTAGVKIAEICGSSSTSGGSNQYAYNLKGIWDNSAVVSSISLISGTGNFDSGTIYIYGAA